MKSLCYDFQVFVVAILKLLIPKSLFNTNSLLFFGSMDFDSSKLYGAIFISDGAVNALYHASKQYYDNELRTNARTLKLDVSDIALY